MSQSKNILEWRAPSWHQDFGDPNIELSILKKLCLYLCDRYSDLEFLLNIIEEGYMSVRVQKKGQHYFEIMVVDIDTKKIGLFFNDNREFYIYENNEIDKYLK